MINGYIYSVDYKAHFRQLYQIFNLVFYLSFIPILMWVEFGIASLSFSLISVGAWLLVMLIPLIYLHYRYWRINGNSVLRISSDGKDIFYMDRVKKLNFSVTDIVDVVTVVSYAKNGDAPRWLPTDSYSYSKVALKNGSQLLITSLLLPESFWPISINERRVSKLLCIV